MEDTHKKFQGAEKIKRLSKWPLAYKHLWFYLLFSAKKKWLLVEVLGVWQATATLGLPDFL